MEEEVPDYLLLCKDADLFCRWMCIFVQETRKENGEEYPPLTVRALLADFQRQMMTNCLFCVFQLNNCFFLMFIVIFTGILH